MQHSVVSLAIARGRAGLKDTNKWQRGITRDCWTDYHCFKRLMGWFLRASSLCELGCWFPYSHNAVQMWVFPVLEAGLFLTATIRLQAGGWGTTITLGCFWALPAITPVTCGHFGHHLSWPLFLYPAPLLPGDKDVETVG